MARQNPGGINPESLLAQLDNKLATIKEATREANESIQGVREVMRDAKKYREELETFTQKIVDERVAEAVAIGLESFKESLDAALEGATKATYGRFDQLSELLLGEDKASRRKGIQTLPEVIMERVDVKPHEFVAIGPDSPLRPCLDCLHCRYPRGNKVIHPEPTDSGV